MDDNRFTHLSDQLDNVQQETAAIKASLNEITQALLGSFDKGGLIEGARIIRKDIDNQALTLESHATQIRAHEVQINDAISFKKEIKRIVGWIAILIPIVFEFVKFAGTWIWELMKTHK